MAYRLTLRHVFRHYSTFLYGDSSTPLSSREKSRALLRLIKSETNPESILEICRSTSLTLDCRQDHNVLSFAVTKLTAAKHFDGIRKFLDELLQSRADLKNEQFISRAIELYGHANMLPHALHTFNHMRDVLHINPSVKSLNALLLASIVAKNYKEVTRIYLVFPKFYSIQPNVDTYNLVIKSFAESSSTSSVFLILDEMDRNSIKPNEVTFNNAIAGFYNEEKFDEVDKLMNLMEEKYKINSDLSTYNVRIKCLCKLKRSSEAKDLLQEMITRGKWPNSDSLTHLINGFSKEGNLEEAKRLFADMNSYYVRDDGSCFFTLVHSFCEHGEFESALEIVKDNCYKGWFSYKNLFACLNLVKKLVNGLVRISKIDDAKELIKEIKEKFPESSSDMWDEVEAGLPEQ